MIWTEAELILLHKHYVEGPLRAKDMLDLLPKKTVQQIYNAVAYYFRNAYERKKRKRSAAPKMTNARVQRRCLTCGKLLNRKEHGYRSTCSDQCREARFGGGQKFEELTPEELGSRIAQIQSEWTPEEEQKRLRCDWRRNEVEIPVITDMGEVA